MNIAISTAVAAGLLVMAGVISSGPDGDRQAIAASVIPQVQVPDGDMFRLRSSRNVSCAVTRGDKIAEDRSELEVEPSCAALLPGIERAKFWQEQEDGSVAFTENGVDAIVSFSVGDGVAYESFKPSTPLISLDEAD
ncbi:hypothetical protein [Mesorhizobium sp. WSM2239]|jgi:hypothetical protein|uniref:Alkaline proteinase inhibitor/ Outer membrane lipoprotein Omp19 domain-containing protein n=2 Tax=unclassified Mesorhizobium TaxID=325217 RepID=A0AAU8DCH2_9HYPH